MRAGDCCCGTVERIVPGGDALLRTEKGVVLLRGAVPGDRVEISLLERRRGVWHGELVRVLEASDIRQEPACPVASLCGGCAMQWVDSAHECDYKSSWVKEAFQSLIEADSAWHPVDAVPMEGRRRLRWFRGEDSEGLFLGFYAAGSHQPVRQQYCMAVSEPLNRLRHALETSLDLFRIEAVQVTALHDGIHVVLEAAEPLQTLPEKVLDDLQVQWWWRDHHGITRPLQKPVKALHDRLPCGERWVDIRIGADDFVQGNMAGNQALIRQVEQWSGEVSRIADLFCGVGNLSLPLAALHGAEVFGVELNQASVRAATANAVALHVNATFVAENLFERAALDRAIGADVLLLDPPRRGAKKICQKMGYLLPRKIIMVSCDPAAGARDGAILRQQGYRMKALRALDLFPGAGHVEAISLWVPA